MLTSLEKAVVNRLLDCPGEPFKSIRQQIGYARGVQRRFTGVGFFTDLTVPAEAHVRRDLPGATIGDVAGEIPGLKNGAGFLLFIRGGVFTMLEGYSYDEPWPAEIKEFKFTEYERANQPAAGKALGPLCFTLHLTGKDCLSRMVVG